MGVAGGYLQLIGVGIVNTKSAVLDYVNYVAASDLLDAGHVAVVCRDNDASAIGIENRQTAPNLATGDIDVGAAVSPDVELSVLANLHAVVISVGDGGRPGKCH